MGALVKRDPGQRERKERGEKASKKKERKKEMKELRQRDQGEGDREGGDGWREEEEGELCSPERKLTG